MIIRNNSLAVGCSGFVSERAARRHITHKPHHTPTLNHRFDIVQRAFALPLAQHRENMFYSFYRASHIFSTSLSVRVWRYTPFGASIRECSQFENIPTLFPPHTPEHTHLMRQQLFGWRPRAIFSFFLFTFASCTCSNPPPQPPPPHYQPHVCVCVYVGTLWQDI